jgi:hypothetical protein
MESMGSATFCTYAPGHDLEDAFAQAVDQAKFEQGHGGYTGSVAEKQYVTCIDARVRWEDEGRDFAQQLIDANDRRITDKWGPAGAIAVARLTTTRRLTLPGSHPRHSDWKALAQQLLPRFNVQHAQVDSFARHGSDHYQDVVLDVEVRKAEAGTIRSKTVTVVVDGGTGQDDFEQNLHQAILTKLRLRKGEQISQQRVVSTSVTADVSRKSGTGRQTRYIIEGDNSHNRFDTGFAAVAEARKHLRELAGLPLGPRSTDQQYVVVGITRAADGGGLVELTKTASRTRVEVEVETVVGAKRPAAHDGWLLFGWASC